MQWRYINVDRNLERPYNVGNAAIAKCDKYVAIRVTHYILVDIRPAPSRATSDDPHNP